MNKTLPILLIVLIAAGFGVWWQFSVTPPPNPKACTQEANLCPDGSYVGRTGPNCEFAACPATYPPVSECIKDSDCPSAFECVQGCGPPVARQDDPPPPYFCQLKGYVRMCPICLAKGTLIDTPLGAVPVQDIQEWSPVWTQSASGMRVVGIVVKTSKTPVPPTHKMVVLVLADGRALLVSSGHPSVDGRTVGDLAEGDVYDGSRVVTAGRVAYSDGATYDILPSGATGFYWANGVLLGSTLR